MSGKEEKEPLDVVRLTYVQLDQRVTGHSRHDSTGNVDYPGKRHTKLDTIYDDTLHPSPVCEIDRGGGVYDWLLNLDSDDDEGRDMNDVSFVSVVGLLELRGGGTHHFDDAAAVSHVTDDNDVTLQPEGDLCCPGCRRRLPHSSDEWTRCSCGTTVCDTCMTTGCPVCQARLVDEPGASRSDRAAELTSLSLQYSGIAGGPRAAHGRPL